MFKNSTNAVANPVLPWPKPSQTLQKPAKKMALSSESLLCPARTSFSRIVTNSSQKKKITVFLIFFTTRHESFVSNILALSHIFATTTTTTTKLVAEVKQNLILLIIWRVSTSSLWHNNKYKESLWNMQHYVCTYLPSRVLLWYFGGVGLQCRQCFYGWTKNLCLCVCGEGTMVLWYGHCLRRLWLTIHV